MKPTLYILSGLPGVGKSALAKCLAREYGAVYLRIDTIEQGLRTLCDFDVQGEGYRLAYRIAEDNLKNGLSVVADSCNPIQLTRDEWETTALQAGAKYINIEVICSDKNEHRERIEKRNAEPEKNHTEPEENHTDREESHADTEESHTGRDGLRLPTWEEVVAREYDQWKEDHIVIDTANTDILQCREALFAIIKSLGNAGEGCDVTGEEKGGECCHWGRKEKP
jgi:predicted kinase